MADEKRLTQGFSISDKSCAVIGLGGLGTNVAVHLAGAGVGKMYLCDFDTVSKTNLNRQFMYTAEDIGICLGQAFYEAMGDKRGITRYADTTLPMDESLILTAVDLSGRAFLGFDLRIPTARVGTFDTELVEEFLLGFVRNAAATVHVRQLAGTNSHHIIEGIFKAVGRCLRAAVRVDPDCAGEIPSTKGLIE